MNWKNRKVLVTGSEGMIGRELVEQLKELVGYGGKIYEIDLKKGHDLTDKKTIDDLFFRYVSDIDYVFHLAGIKGNPKMTNERPVDFIGPMLQFDTNMILFAQKVGAKRFLYTSSIAVENPDSDRYPAWAKRTGEVLIDAMRIQYPKGTRYCIVRPSNVYGRYDNFDNPSAMVVTNLINKAIKDKKLILDIHGSAQVRDIINAKDVARGMIKAMENMPPYPVNLCYGKGTKINDIAVTIVNELNIPLDYDNLNLVHGPDVKVMKGPYIKPEIEGLISLKDGIKEVIDYVNNRNTS